MTSLIRKEAPSVMTPRQLAENVVPPVNLRTVWKWMARKVVPLPFHKRGGRRLIQKDAALIWMGEIPSDY